MIPIGIALDGCAGIASAVALAPQIVQYVGVIAQAVSVVEPFITGLTGISSSVSGTIASAIASVKAAVSGTVATASGLVSGVGTMAGLLSGIKGLPASVETFLTNATALLPSIEQALGIVATVTAPAAQHRFARMAATITPEQAVANLLALGTR
jgi:hypothetical protein